MNTIPPASSFEDRLLALEARIAELEQQCEVAHLDIPWHVICAAVAAVMPDVRVIHIEQARSSANRWQTSALLRNVNSHQIR
jgi:hypothetical protein